MTFVPITLNILEWVYGLIQGFLVTLVLLVWIIELLCRHEIKMNYILENKIYNIFWLIGFISSGLCFLFFIFYFYCKFRCTSNIWIFL